MRYLLTTGVLAFCIAASNALALADPASNAAQPAAVTVPAASAPTAVSPNAAAATDSEAPGVPVQSPDVAEWTAQLIHEQQVQAGHKAAAAQPHALGRFASRIISRTSRIAKNLTRDALRFLGTPYVFGGTTSSGFDCSGFVQHVFAMLGVSVPRTADAQYYAGHRARGGVKAGDLVFFQTYAPGPSHVGIYIGNGKFVHASSHGVMVSSLSDSYWSERYLGAKRVIAQTR